MYEVEMITKYMDLYSVNSVKRDLNIDFDILSYLLYLHIFSLEIKLTYVHLTTNFNFSLQMSSATLLNKTMGGKNVQIV